MSTIKRFFLSLLVTPERVRKVIAHVLAWLIHWCVDRGAWDAVSTFPKWLRKLADFIEQWNNTELPAEQDYLLADLVADAVTDEDVDSLLGTVSAMAAVPQVRKGGA